MRVEVMQHFGLTRPLSQADYFETDHHKQIIKDIRGAIMDGRLIAVCGVVGSGKTVTLRRLLQQLEEERRITVCKSLAVEKRGAKLSTLIAALFLDLSPDKSVRIPTDREKHERELCELVKKHNRPVVLFVDDAHDLHSHTLAGIGHWMGVIGGSGGRLSVVLAGHPKLKNDLRRLTMEEVGYQTDIFTLDGITGSQHQYIHWLLANCTDGIAKPDSILTEDAIDLLAAKLRTPLQVQRYLSLAIEVAYRTGGSPVTTDVVEAALSNQPDDLEPKDQLLATERPLRY